MTERIRTEPSDASDLRLLVLYQGFALTDHPGYHDGFGSAAAQGALGGYEGIPYLGVARDLGWQEAFKLMSRAAEDFRADAVLLQHFHSAGMPTANQFTRMLSELTPRPVIATSCGDPFGGPMRQPPASLTSAAAGSDVVFSSGMSALANRLSSGGKRVALLPLSACQVRFPSAHISERVRQPEFDVVFVGNLSAARNPTNRLLWASRRRVALIKCLERRYGPGLAVFGSGWGGVTKSWQGPIASSLQQQTYRRGRLAFGGFPNNLTDYYASDRPFIVGSSGVPLVDWEVPRVDRIFGRHGPTRLVHDKASLIETTDSMLDLPESGRDALGAQFAEDCATRHRTSHRTQFMTDVFASLRTAQRTGGLPRRPILPFLEPSVDQALEVDFAFRNWAGAS